jgi:phosphate/sulfate permease
MSPFWKIFTGIFCYISALVGIGLAVLNASEKPPATTHALVYGVAGAAFLVGAVVMTRKPRY